jgi:hypothetical protein
VLARVGDVVAAAEDDGGATGVCPSAARWAAASMPTAPPETTWAPALAAASASQAVTPVPYALARRAPTKATLAGRSSGPLPRTASRTGTVGARPALGETRG